MTWDDLRFVLAATRGKTLVRAGAELGVAHTTVGRRLAALEEGLGVRLFDRTPDGLVATAAGADLAAVAEGIEADVLAVEGRVLGRDAELRGDLRVSTVDVLFTCFAHAFASFVKRYPGVTLSVSISRDTVSLARREADVVLRVTDAPPEAWVGRQFGDLQFGVYAARSLLAQVGQGAPLAAFPWIGWEGGPNTRWFEGWLAANAPGATIVLRMDERGLPMVDAVRAGIGAQILPCVLADVYPELARIAPLDETFRLGVWLLTLPDLRTNSRVRAFMTHMDESIAAGRDALAGRAPGRAKPP